jgi:16S rRNA (uracil1498-N3)-methyltransferase
MSESRFFVAQECVPGREVALAAEDARHARLVLRLRTGDRIVVVRDGSAWEATLTASSSSGVLAQVGQRRDETGGELPVAVTVMQALIKGAKFDYVVEKVVELGARRIIPMRSERCAVEPSEHKVERWRRIARAAAQQARRRYEPIVEEPVAWRDGLAHWRGTTPPVVAYEEAPPGTLAPALARIPDDIGELAIAIGPEGGLGPADVAAAEAVGCPLVSLGPTILRTDTAALAMLAAIAARRGWW